MNVPKYFPRFFLFTFFAFCLNSVFSSLVRYDTTHLEPIEVTALGRVAQLSEFYDIRNDQFLHFIKVTENKETRLTYSMVNSFREKFDNLDVSAELQLSVLSGLVNLKGAGRYFKDTKASAKSAKATLIQSISSVYEQVSILDTSLQSSINFDVVSQIDATHVVVGIEWGGNVFISVEDLNEESEEAEVVEGNLAADIKFMSSQIAGKGALNISDEERANFSRFSFEIYGDLVPKSVPETIFDALEFMKTSSEDIIEANDQKGKAIKYVLLPLDGLKQFWALDRNETQSLIYKIDQITIHNCIVLFDDIVTMSQDINDVYKDAKKFAKFITGERWREIQRLQKEFLLYQTALSANLSHHLVKVRAGEEDITILQNILLQNAKSNENLWKNDYNTALKKIRWEVTFLQLLQDGNVLLFNKDDLLNEFLWKYYENTTFMLFYTFADDLLSENAVLFFRFLILMRNLNLIK